MFKETFRGLIAATGGDPGGLCGAISRLNVWFAICMHSSSVFRKVAHVDFTMFPVSMPVWEGQISYQNPTLLSHTVVSPTTEASLISPGHSNLILTSAVSTSSSLSLILFTCCRRRSQYSLSSDIFVFSASVFSWSSAIEVTSQLFKSFNSIYIINVTMMTSGYLFLSLSGYLWGKLWPFRAPPAISASRLHWSLGGKSIVLLVWSGQPV